MRRLVVWNVMTLDGFFEGDAPWALSFHETVWGDELEALSLQQGAEMDTLIFGRRTYEGMAAYWSGEAEPGPIRDMMNGMRKVVASRTLKTVDWANSSLIEGDVVKGVRALKAEASDKNIYVFGSADLLKTLLAAGLVDEYRVCIAPAVGGGGNPLFKPRVALSLDLLDARPLKTGGVLIRYGVKT